MATTSRRKRNHDAMMYRDPDYVGFHRHDDGDDGDEEQKFTQKRRQEEGVSSNGMARGEELTSNMESTFKRRRVIAVRGNRRNTKTSVALNYDHQSYLQEHIPGKMGAFEYVREQAIGKASSLNRNAQQGMGIHPTQVSFTQEEVCAMMGQWDRHIRKSYEGVIISKLQDQFSRFHDHERNYVRAKINLKECSYVS